jgi:DNA-binding response OmpR family regulator
LTFIGSACENFFVPFDAAANSLAAADQPDRSMKTEKNSRANSIGGLRTDQISSKRCLIVEDDDDLRELLVDAMCGANYQSLGVAGVGEFQEVASAQHWDIAIIDVNLPDGSGYAVARALRQFKETRIIILTGRSALADRLESHAAGGDVHIVKPAHLAELLAVAKTLLARRDEISAADSGWLLENRTSSLRAPSGRTAKLTPREFAVLELLMGNPGLLVATKKLLETASDHGDDLTSDALRMLLSRLRHRVLKVTGETLPVETIVGRGLIYRPSSG